MSSYLTLGEARKRLKDVTPADFDLTDAINETCARAYDIGRWSGSRATVTLATADKYQDTDSGGEWEDYWFGKIDGDLYDGVLSFKVNGWGDYKIRPITEEFENRGWLGFIEHPESEDSASTYLIYQLPPGVTDSDRITALVKKRWQNVYEDEDKLALRSFAALKAGILAVNLENENEVNASQAKWQEMERLLLLDDKQRNGGKQIKVSFKPNYYHKPYSTR